MPVLDFPWPTLTAEDEAAIVQRLRQGAHYSVRREDAAAVAPSLALLNEQRQERGRITKQHGVYAVQDARGHVILETRHLEDVLNVLSK